VGVWLRVHRQRATESPEIADIARHPTPESQGGLSGGPVIAAIGKAKPLTTKDTKETQGRLPKIGEIENCWKSPSSPTSRVIAEIGKAKKPYSSDQHGFTMGKRFSLPRAAAPHDPR
jgi:hypothetical protein